MATSQVKRQSAMHWGLHKINILEDVSFSSFITTGF